MSGVSNGTTTPGPNWNTETNHAPVVSVISWLMIVCTFLTVFTRVGTRWEVLHKLRGDDYAIIWAFLFAVGETIAASLAANTGLGQVASDPLAPLTDMQEHLYTVPFLFIASVTASKISLCIYLHSLTPNRVHRMAAMGIGIFTLLWAFSSMFVHGFECKLPHPWLFLSETCINQVAFWTYFDVINAVTDIGLIVLPCLILAGLQVESHKKMVIVICFGTRILTVAAIIVQIVYYNRAYADAPTTEGGLAYTLWIPVLMVQIVQALSIITACIPYLKPFLEALDTGMIRAGGAGTTTYGNYGSRGPSSKRSGTTTQNSNELGGELSTGGRSTRKKSGLGSKMSSIISGGGGGAQRSFGNGGAVKLESIPGTAEGTNGHHKAVNGGDHTVPAAGALTNDVDRDSQGSRTGIIKKTVDWEVSDDRQEPGVAV